MKLNSTKCPESIKNYGELAGEELLDQLYTKRDSLPNLESIITTLCYRVDKKDIEPQIKLFKTRFLQLIDFKPVVKNIETSIITSMNSTYSTPYHKLHALYFIGKIKNRSVYFSETYLKYLIDTSFEDKADSVEARKTLSVVLPTLSAPQLHLYITQITSKLSDVHSHKASAMEVLIIFAPYITEEKLMKPILQIIMVAFYEIENFWYSIHGRALIELTPYFTPNNWKTLTYAIVSPSFLRRNEHHGMTTFRSIVDLIRVSQDVLESLLPLLESHASQHITAKLLQAIIQLHNTSNYHSSDSLLVLDLLTPYITTEPLSRAFFTAITLQLNVDNNVVMMRALDILRSQSHFYELLPKIIQNQLVEDLILRLNHCYAPIVSYSLDILSLMVKHISTEERRVILFNAVVLKLNDANARVVIAALVILKSIANDIETYLLRNDLMDAVILKIDHSNLNVVELVFDILNISIQYMNSELEFLEFNDRLVSMQNIYTQVNLNIRTKINGSILSSLCLFARKLSQAVFIEPPKQLKPLELVEELFTLRIIPAFRSNAKYIFLTELNALFDLTQVLALDSKLELFNQMMYLIDCSHAIEQKELDKIFDISMSLAYSSELKLQFTDAIILTLSHPGREKDRLIYTVTKKLNNDYNNDHLNSAVLNTILCDIEILSGISYFASSRLQEALVDRLPEQYMLQEFHPARFKLWFKRFSFILIGLAPHITGDRQQKKFIELVFLKKYPPAIEIGKYSFFLKYPPDNERELPIAEIMSAFSPNITKKWLNDLQTCNLISIQDKERIVLAILPYLGEDMFLSIEPEVILSLFNNPEKNLYFLVQLLPYFASIINESDLNKALDEGIAQVNAVENQTITKAFLVLIAFVPYIKSKTQLNKLRDVSILNMEHCDAGIRGSALSLISVLMMRDIEIKEYLTTDLSTSLSACRIMANQLIDSYALLTCAPESGGHVADAPLPILHNLCQMKGSNTE